MYNRNKNVSYIRKLSENHKKMLTPGQLMAFRQFKHAHLNLPGNQELELSFLLSLDNKHIDTHIDIDEIDTDKPVILVNLDSSYICSNGYDFMERLFDLELEYPSYRIIIVNTGISYMESKYKTINRKKYCHQNINWTSMKSFIDLCDNKLKYLGNISMIHTSFSLMHTELCKTENKYSSYGLAMMNTINDEAQVNILLRYVDELSRHVTVLPIVFTCDMKMKKYCYENNVGIIDI